MDLGAWLPWLNLLHVLAVMAFIFIHGASGLLALRLRGERDRGRIMAMAQLSGSFIGLGWAAIGLLVIAGILAGIVGGWWTSGRLWIWASVVVFIVVVGLMTPVATAYMARVRTALGLPGRDARGREIPASEPVSDEELLRIVNGNGPILAALIGVVGIVALTWLMMLKPF
jgi:membrane protein implicated in regulation of membrane protease activity